MSTGVYKIDESHVDHGLTDEQLEYALSNCHGSSEVLVEQVELPEYLGTVPCGLYGPAMGDAPVAEFDAYYNERPGRDGKSRLVMRPFRRSRTVTVVSGPHNGAVACLYTAYGGPAAPREMFEDDSDESAEFWAEHALSDARR